MTAATAPVITSADRLSLTIFLAAAIHAVLILGVTFVPLDPAKLDAPPSLEVILVQERDQSEPEKADYFAQISQEGGGESEERHRPSNPFASTEVTDTAGIAPQPLLGGNPEVAETAEQPVLTKLHDEEKIQQHEKQLESKLNRQQNQEDIDFDLEIARLTAELAIAQEQYAKRPRKLVLTASTHERSSARYEVQWKEKVERIGNLNYPQEAVQRKIEGVLMLEVELKWDGSIVEVNLLQSSGSNILDEAAKQIVQLAAPFPAFPPELRDKADHVEIVRSWMFSNGGLNTRK